MKHMISLLLTLSFGLFAQANASVVPTLKHTDVNRIYVPDGYDSNDMTEIVIRGVLPNLCYYSPSSRFKVKDQRISIDLLALYTKNENQVCSKTKLPFTETVTLGILAEGTYEIVVNEGTEYQKSSWITVQQPESDEINNYIYAHVENASYDYEENVLTLTGTNPSDCLDLERVEVQFNKRYTFVVLPILKIVNDECRSTPSPFKYEVRLPKRPATKVPVLIHIRKMTGKSLNILI